MCPHGHAVCEVIPRCNWCFHQFQQDSRTFKRDACALPQGAVITDSTRLTCASSTCRIFQPFRWWIENPSSGLLDSRPFFQAWLNSMPTAVRTDVSYCSYGHLQVSYPVECYVIYLLGSQHDTQCIRMLVCMPYIALPSYK